MSLSSGCVLEVDGSAVESLVSKDRNHHTLVPTDCITTRGKAGKGTLFNGTTSFVNCGAETSLNVTDAMTAEVLIKGVSQPAYFLSKYDYNTDVSFGFGSTNGKLRVIITDNGIYEAGHSKDYESSITALDGTWHRVGFSFDSGTLKLYVDGVEDLSPTKTKDDAITTIHQGTVDVLIGARHSGGIVGLLFNGTISLTRIYNYALSPTEIRRSYLSKAYLYAPHPVRIP